VKLNTEDFGVVVFTISFNVQHCIIVQLLPKQDRLGYVMMVLCSIL